MSQKQNLALGVNMNILGYLCIALMATVAKLLPPTISVTTLVFFQNLVCLMLVLPHVYQGGIEGLKTEHWKLHLVRDLTGLLSFFMLFTAVKYIPLVNAVLLQNAAPLWIPFVIFFWLRKKVSTHLWFTIPFGFIGIIMILKPGLAMLASPGTIVGLLSGILLAIALVSIRRLKLTEPIYRILFYYFLVGTIAMLPFVFSHWIMPTLKDFSLLIAIGMLMYFAQILITYSFHHAKVSTLSPLSYSTIIFSAILGWLIWKHVPDIWVIIGGILVIVSGVFSILLEKQAKEA